MASKFYNLDTDNTLGGSSASDNIIASQKAVKSYVDNNAQPVGNYVTTNTTQTISGVKTYTGAVHFIGSGDTNAVFISTNTRFDVEGTTKTILGFGNNVFYINHTSYELQLRGSGTRPKYNSSSYLALTSDIPTDLGDLTNNAGYTKNVGTVTSVNGQIPNASGEVTISVPTKISNLTDDTSTNPIDKADTLTNLTASITELNYTDGVTSNIQTQFDTINKGYVSNGSILTTDYNNIKYYYDLSFDESKFTKVGTPTIIDGVASGFSASNFFTLTTSISATTSLKYTLKFTTPASLSTNQPIVALRNSDSSNYIDMWIQSGALRLRAYTGTNVNKSFTISANTTYYAQIEYAGGTWKGRVSTDGSTWTEQTLGTAPILSAIINTNIARYSGTTFEGAIDLKVFEIVADGILAFTGKKDGTDTYNINNVTVLIPYTVCKIGRIVDSSYRTTLDTIYTNYGYVPYYTLDTTNQNYTLPKGEVFGLMSIISKNAIQDS